MNDFICEIMELQTKLIVIPKQINMSFLWRNKFGKTRQCSQIIDPDCTIQKMINSLIASANLKNIVFRRIYSEVLKTFRSRYTEFDKIKNLPIKQLYELMGKLTTELIQKGKP